MNRTADDGVERIYAVCGGCTLMAVKIAYERCLWFRLIRGPLWLGMWLLSWWHGFDADDYLVRNKACHGCIRFRKLVLWERSRLFWFLNGYIAGPFGQLLGKLAVGSRNEEKVQFANESTYHSLAEALDDLRQEVESGTSTRHTLDALAYHGGDKRDKRCL